MLGKITAVFKITVLLRVEGTHLEGFMLFVTQFCEFGFCLFLYRVEFLGIVFSFPFAPAVLTFVSRNQ